MNANSKNPYGTSFFIRMGVLLLLLLGVGGAFAYDRLVLVPAGKEAVNRVVNACMDPGADKSAVHAAAGCKPTYIETAGQYEIADYSFGRILPNLEGYKVTVVYLDGKVAESFRGGISDADRAEYKKNTTQSQASSRVRSRRRLIAESFAA